MADPKNTKDTKDDVKGVGETVTPPGNAPTQTPGAVMPEQQNAMDQGLLGDNAPAAVSSTPTTDGYQSPAEKWDEYAAHWGKYSGAFAKRFALDSSDVKDASGDRDALAKVMEQTLRLPIALCYQQLDAYVATLRV